MRERHAPDRAGPNVYQTGGAAHKSRSGVATGRDSGDATPASAMPSKAMSAEAVLWALAELLAPFVAERVEATQDEPWTVQEAADYLRVTPAQVRRLIDEGEIEAADIGLGTEKRSIRLSRRELAQFVERRKGMR